MFSVTMLPAGHGDCLWVEWGKASAPRRMLIDAGTPGTYKRLKAAIKDRLGNGKAHFDLFVITHIDEDHIGGAIRLLEDSEVTYGDLWFNGWKHLREKAPRDLLGAKQAELVTDTIQRRKLPWNTAFGGKAVVIDKDLPTVPLGEAKLTLLSPYRQQLHDLIPKWRAELVKAGLVDAAGNLLHPRERARRIRDQLGVRSLNIETLLKEPFESDAAEANGSSIAFLLEHGGKRALFTGDAHPGVLAQSLRQLSASDRKLDVVKVPHHGSDGNTSADLLSLVSCNTYLLSTNGARYSHPDRAALARIVGRGNKSRLCFNYTTSFTTLWNNAIARQKYRFQVDYPTTKDGGFSLEL